MNKYILFFVALVLSSCEYKIPEKLSEKEKEMLVDELSKMMEKDGKNRNDIPDELWHIQAKVDKENTKRLLEITRKYGFPNNKRIGTSLGAFMIFAHSPEEYFEEIKLLLEKEHLANRIVDNNYKFIQWHLSGRKGLPSIEGVEMIDNRPNSQGKIDFSDMEISID